MHFFLGQSGECLQRWGGYRILQLQKCQSQGELNPTMDQIKCFQILWLAAPFAAAEEGFYSKFTSLFLQELTDQYVRMLSSFLCLPWITFQYFLKLISPITNLPFIPVACVLLLYTHYIYNSRLWWVGWFSTFSLCKYDINDMVRNAKIHLLQMAGDIYAITNGERVTSIEATGIWRWVGIITQELSPRLQHTYLHWGSTRPLKSGKRVQVCKSHTVLHRYSVLACSSVQHRFSGQS